MGNALMQNMESYNSAVRNLPSGLDAVPPGFIGRLMMIDDNEVDHMLVHRTVKKSGLVGEYLTYAWAEEALAALRQGLEVDAILLDVNMPQMDGFEFLAAARAEFGLDQMPVVALMLTTELSGTALDTAQCEPAITTQIAKPLRIDALAGLGREVARRQEEKSHDV